MFAATLRAPRRHRSKRRVLSACGSLLAAGALITAMAPAANADPSSCSDGNVCVWNGVYEGAKNNYGISNAGWKVFDRVKLSMKNRFTNRRVYTYKSYGGVVYEWECLNPGDNRGGGTFWSTVIYIDAPGTRC